MKVSLLEITESGTRRREIDIPTPRGAETDAQRVQQGVKWLRNISKLSDPIEVRKSCLYNPLLKTPNWNANFGHFVAEMGKERDILRYMRALKALSNKRLAGFVVQLLAQKLIGNNSQEWDFGQLIALNRKNHLLVSKYSKLLLFLSEKKKLPNHVLALLKELKKSLVKDLETLIFINKDPALTLLYRDIQQQIESTLYDDHSIRQQPVLPSQQALASMAPAVSNAPKLSHYLQHYQLLPAFPPLPLLLGMRK